MSRVKEKIRNIIMSISYQERRKKKLEKYRQELARLREMDDDELGFEYISVKSEYEHKKNVITIFMLSIVIAAFMGAWNYFFAFVEKILQYAVAGQGNEEEIAKVVFVFSAVVIILITIIAFWILIEHTKRMYELNKYLINIEMVRKGRHCG